MLWEEMERYTKLTGEDATHVPIMKLGAYLDGYEKGIEVLDKIRAEIEETYTNITYQENRDRKATWGLRKALEIIDKYKAESENQ